MHHDKSKLFFVADFEVSVTDSVSLKQFVYNLNSAD
jgi:hypothetical protein